MPIFIPGGRTEVIAMQYRDNMSELDMVNLFDWIHDIDSSTIYGAVVGSIMKDIETHQGYRIPYKDPKTEVFYPQKSLALVGDWIIKHGPLNFTVLTNEVFQDLYYVKAH